MTSLLKTITGAVEAQVKAQVQAGAKSVALVFAAIFFVVCGFVALMFAVYLALTAYMRPEFAALIIAGLFTLTGIIVLLCLKKGSPSEAKQQTHKANTADIRTELEQKITAYVHDNPKSATIAALLAGAAVGASPELRNILLRELDRHLSAGDRDG